VCILVTAHACASMHMLACDLTNNTYDERTCGQHPIAAALAGIEQCGRRPYPSNLQSRARKRHAFSKVRCIVAVHSKYSRALTSENLLQESRSSTPGASTPSDSPNENVALVADADAAAHTTYKFSATPQALDHRDAVVEVTPYKVASVHPRCAFSFS